MTSKKKKKVALKDIKRIIKISTDIASQLEACFLISVCVARVQTWDSQREISGAVTASTAPCPPLPGTYQVD